MWPKSQSIHKSFLKKRYEFLEFEGPDLREGWLVSRLCFYETHLNSVVIEQWRIQIDGDESSELYSPCVTGSPHLSCPPLEELACSVHHIDASAASECRTQDSEN